MMQVTAARLRLDGITPRAWDELAHGNFYSTTAWLRYCAGEMNVPCTGVVGIADGKPAWAVPVNELPSSAVEPSVPHWSRYMWNAHLTSFGLPLLPPSGLLVGPTEGYQTRFLSVPSENPLPGLADLVARLRAMCGPRRQPRGTACVAMYTTNDDVRALRRAGITVPPVLLDTDAWIHVPEGGWPAWLASVSKNHRHNARRKEREFREAGYRIEHTPLADCYQRLGVASAATVVKYGGETTAAEDTAALRRVAEELGDAAMTALLLREDGQAAGFCVYYVFGDVVFNRWAGFDYSLLANAAEYANVLFYEQIKRAPLNGVRWVHAGATAAAAKAHCGAELRPLWLVDLTEDSPLERCRDEVCQHNAQFYRRLAEDPFTGSAITGADSWLEFN
jgi:uncharacterized protein